MSLRRKCSSVNGARGRAPSDGAAAAGRLSACDVLIVEDDFANKYLCEAVLRKAGFRVASAADCAEAREAMACRQFRVMLLDLGLPDGDGFDLLAELRPSQAALIMTVRGEPEQRAQGLRSGAVDYIVKPFHPDELVWRVGRAAAAPEPRTADTDHMRWGDFTLDRSRRQLVGADGDSLRLTAGETEILARLLRRGSVVATEVLADAVASGVGNSRSVSVLISRLRAKFRDRPAFRAIQIISVAGLGYHIELRSD